MSSERGLKGLSIGLIIFYIGYFTLFFILQFIYWALSIALIVLFIVDSTPSNTHWILNLVSCMVEMVQSVYLFLCTFVALFFIVGITAKLSLILSSHYNTIKEHLKLQPDNVELKSQTRKVQSALVTVLFFMISIMLTLLFTCVQYILMMIAAIFESLGGTIGNYLTIAATCGFAVIVFAVLIIAIVLYSPRSFKSIQLSTIWKKLDPVAQKKEAEQTHLSTAFRKSLKVMSSSTIAGSDEHLLQEEEIPATVTAAVVVTAEESTEASTTPV